MEYFTHRNLTDRIIQIVDRTKTAMYLVLGKDKACLIDTGSGIGSLREYVDGLTNLTYDVILTHGHVDHASGAYEFVDKNIYLHPEDKELMRVHTIFENRIDYMLHVMHEEVDEAVLIPQLDPERTKSLSHADRFDLGGLNLEIIHTPGHTRGICMVLIEEEKTILFGDGCGVSVMLLDEYATSVEEYYGVLRNLKSYESRYDNIIRNHGTFTSPKELLDNVIECCVCILNGTDDKFSAVGLPVHYDDAYFAKALDINTHGRVDGKQGNLAYRPEKINS